MRTTSRLVAEDAARIAAKPSRTQAGLPTVSPPPTRQGNILASRADGTFEAKRAAYNQAGQATGHSMDEAGNIIAPPPAATTAKPGGQLIPGHSPGSYIWQSDTPASQPGQPPSTTVNGTPGWTPVPGGEVNNKGQVRATAPASSFQQTDVPSPPSVLPPTLKRPAAPRPGGLINGRPATEEIAATKAAQTQIPRQTARNGVAPPAVQLPTVASAITPPVTNNVTRNVTSRVTPPVTPPSPSQGPAAKALSDFNAANPNVMTVAQTDALAAERRGQIADAQNTLKTQREAPHRQLQKDMMKPYAPVKQLNNGIASIDATGPGAQITTPAQDLAEAIRPGVNAQRAKQGVLPPTPAPASPSPPQTIANNSQPPQTPPTPGYFAQKAANNPDGIISKGIEAAGMLQNSIKTGGQNITNAAQVVAPIAASPLLRAKQAGQNAIKTITGVMQQQAARNPLGVFGRLTTNQPTKTKIAPPSKFAGKNLLP
jgi:hypothetical protein